MSGRRSRPEHNSVRDTAKPSHELVRAGLRAGDTVLRAVEGDHRDRYLTRWLEHRLDEDRHLSLRDDFVCPR
jgi:hypothetical protein